MAWNSIYREFREDATAVDIWTLELLVRLVTCLALAHNDSPSLGTHQQAMTAIAHVERIIKVRKEIFTKVCWSLFIFSLIQFSITGKQIKKNKLTFC